MTGSGRAPPEKRLDDMSVVEFCEMHLRLLRDSPASIADIDAVHSRCERLLEKHSDICVLVRLVVLLFSRASLLRSTICSRQSRRYNDARMWQNGAVVLTSIALCHGTHWWRYALQ